MYAEKPYTKEEVGCALPVALPCGALVLTSWYLHRGLSCPLHCLQGASKVLVCYDLRILVWTLQGISRLLLTAVNASASFLLVRMQCNFQQIMPRLHPKPASRNQQVLQLALLKSGTGCADGICLPGFWVVLRSLGSVRSPMLQVMLFRVLYCRTRQLF